MNQFFVAPPFIEAKNIAVMKATVNLMRMLSLISISKKIKKDTSPFISLLEDPRMLLRGIVN